MDVEFFPTSLSDMGFEEDLREFMKETEEIYHETGMPMIPCFLHHFCLPFSPICVLCYCQSKRKSRLEDLVEDFNKEKAYRKRRKRNIHRKDLSEEVTNIKERKQ